jgi:hypothetical protein
MAEWKSALQPLGYAMSGSGRRHVIGTNGNVACAAGRIVLAVLFHIS